MSESAATRLTPVAGLCALVIAALLICLVPGSAGAASVVGPNGQVSGCYKKKGKGKGALRVVPAKKRCKKGEKRLTWNAQGPQGQTGGQGGTGATGGSGDAGLQSQITDLRSQITQLTSQLAALTGQLNSVCGELETVVGYARGVGGVLGALDLGLPLLDLGNLIPPELDSFACP